MDIGKFETSEKSNAGADLTIRHPETGKDTDIVITLLGADSKAFRDASREARRDALKEQSEDPREMTIRVVTACTVGWKGIEENGEPVEHSDDAAVDLYTRYPWLLAQCDRFINERANFFRG